MTIETIRKTFIAPEVNYQEEDEFEESPRDMNDREESPREMNDRDDEEDEEEEEKRMFDKVEMLEAMIENIKENEKERQGMVDEKQMKKNIDENLGLVEDIKQMYPIENEDDEKVQETILAYEKQLIKLKDKIEEDEGREGNRPGAVRKSTIVNPDVKKKADRADHQVIEMMEDIIQVMNTKSEVGSLSNYSRPSMINKVERNQDKRKPSNMYESQIYDNEGQKKGAGFGEENPRKSRNLDQREIIPSDNPRKSKVGGQIDQQPSNAQRKSKMFNEDNDNKGLNNNNSHLFDQMVERKSKVLNQNDLPQKPSENERKSKLLNHSDFAQKSSENERKSKFLTQNDLPQKPSPNERKSKYLDPKDVEENKKSWYLTPISKGDKKDSVIIQYPPRKSAFVAEKQVDFHQKKNPFKSNDDRFASQDEDLEDLGVKTHAGDFVKTVVLNKCTGAVTVIKIIKETVLAVGYSSGELAFYSLTEDFKFLAKQKEHGSSITSMESGELCLNLGAGLVGKEVLLTGGNERDKTVVIWEIATFRPIQKLKGHQHMVTSIVDLRDFSTIATASMDSKIAFWDVRGAEPACIQVLEDLQFPIVVMEYDSDDCVLSTGTLDGQIGIWQVYLEDEVYAGCALTKILNLECHVLDIVRSSFLPNSVITLESDFSVREYDMRSGRLLRTIKADRPLLDIFVVESNGGKSLILYAIDNTSNLHRVKDYASAPAKITLPPTNSSSEVHIKRYLGYNPKSQIFIKKNELLLITADQTNQTLTINRLNIE